MNLLETYSRKLGLLPEGQYLEGLRAVQRHIEAGFAHFVRGQESNEDSAFTNILSTKSSNAGIDRQGNPRS